MAYEKVEIVVSSISGEVYMARVLKDGTMSESRRIVTEDCLRGTTEWFMQNKKKMVQFGTRDSNVKATIFYTGDAEKAKRILEILEEE